MSEQKDENKTKIRNKLDQLLEELNQNLPEINFEGTNNNEVYLMSKLF